MLRILFSLCLVVLIVKCDDFNVFVEVIKTLKPFLSAKLDPLSLNILADFKENQSSPKIASFLREESTKDDLKATFEAEGMDSFGRMWLTLKIYALKSNQMEEFIGDKVLVEPFNGCSEKEWLRTTKKAVLTSNCPYIFPIIASKEIEYVAPEELNIPFSDNFTFNYNRITFDIDSLDLDQNLTFKAMYIRNDALHDYRQQNPVFLPTITNTAFLGGHDPKTANRLASKECLLQMLKVLKDPMVANALAWATLDVNITDQITNPYQTIARVLFPFMRQATDFKFLEVPLDSIDSSVHTLYENSYFTNVGFEEAWSNFSFLIELLNPQNLPTPIALEQVPLRYTYKLDVNAKLYDLQSEYLSSVISSVPVAPKLIFFVADAEDVMLEQIRIFATKTSSESKSRDAKVTYVQRRKWAINGFTQYLYVFVHPEWSDQYSIEQDDLFEAPVDDLVFNNVDLTSTANPVELERIKPIQISNYIQHIKEIKNNENVKNNENNENEQLSGKLKTNIAFPCGKFLLILSFIAIVTTYIITIRYFCYKFKVEKRSSDA